jgi:ABC-2 type transport system permease protein
MPIHDQGYKRYAGTREAHGRAWAVIARQHVLSAVKSKVFVMFLVGAWIQFVVRSVQVYVSTLGQAAILQVTNTTYRDFFSVQAFFVFVLSIAMSGLIADDRRANALQVYLSKPLTRVEYVAGKLAAMMVFLLGVTLLPALLLLLVQTLFTGTAFVRANLFLVPAVVLYALTHSLLSASLLLALSSLTKSRRFVSVMYAGVFFFTLPMYGALFSITGSRAWAVIAPSQLLIIIGDTIFRVPGERPVPAYVAAAVVIALIGASVWVLERRIRGVEVVA